MNVFFFYYYLIQKVKNYFVFVVKCVIDGWKMSGKISMIKVYIDGVCFDFKIIYFIIYEVYFVRVLY